MITVLFFASIREQLGIDKVSLQNFESGQTVLQLIQNLATTHGEEWSQCLLASNVIASVNQQVVDGHQLLAEGDEVAFFPPVTGG